MNNNADPFRLKRIIEFVHLTERTILVISSTLVWIGICIAVFLRYFLRKDLFGLEEILMILGFWLYFIGGAYGSYTRTQIKAELLDFIFSNPIIISVVKTFGNIISFIMAAFLLKWSYEMAIWGWQNAAHTPVFNLPMVMAHAPLVLGFLLMSVYTLVELAEEIRNLMNLRGKSNSMSA